MSTETSEYCHLVPELKRFALLLLGRCMQRDTQLAGQLLQTC